MMLFFFFFCGLIVEVEIGGEMVIDPTKNAVGEADFFYVSCRTSPVNVDGKIRLVSSCSRHTKMYRKIVRILT